VLLIDEFVRAQPASEAVVQALVRVLEHDANTTVRTLAARSLRHISEQRDHPPSLVAVLQQAVAGDPEAAVRREALAGLIAAAAVDALSPGVLPPEAMAQLLQAALGDPDTRVRFLAVQVLGKVYATQAPDPATLQRLIKRLGEEPDAQVRSHIAVTLQAIHARQGLEPAVIEPLVPLVTADPDAAVRQAISRILIELPAGQGGLDTWMQATAAMGLSPAGAATPVELPESVPRHDRDALSVLQARLLGQYVSALSGGRDRAVRTEILQGLFALALAEPLPPQAVDVLARCLGSDTDAGLRLQAAAVLLYNSLRHHGDEAPFYAALDDGDARLQDYAAFALVELNAVDGELLPGLLGFARDSSAHRTLRGYSLRRLGLWRAAGGVLPASVQTLLLDLTADPDVELRTEAWNVLRQFDLTEQDWLRAAADDDLGIRRMAWWELQALGVTKPVRARWRDPKQRLELIAAGLLGATVVAVIAGALLFFWRLLYWLWGTRQQKGRMLAAQLLWLVAALLTVAADAGILFAVGMAHSGLSVKDLMQLNTLFGVILALYVAVACLGWWLLPRRLPVRRL
jgi:HEAT repeat protein